MKYITYLFFIGVITASGFFVYNKYWKNDKKITPIVTVKQDQESARVRKPSPNPLVITDNNTRAQKPKPAGPAALIESALAAAAAGDNAKALETYRKILAEHRNTTESLRAAIALGDNALAGGGLWNARALYTYAFGRLGRQSSERRSVYAKITGINDKLVWSTRVYPGARDAATHIVQPGEVLDKIAARYNCPRRFIQKMNKLQSTSIRYGQRIKVIRGIDSRARTR
jgi:LysM repeat protein